MRLVRTLKIASGEKFVVEVPAVRLARESIAVGVTSVVKISVVLIDVEKRAKDRDVPTTETVVNH